MWILLLLIVFPFSLPAQHFTDSLGKRQDHWVIYGIDQPSSGYPDSVKGLPFKPGSNNKIFNNDGEIWQDGTLKNGQLWNGKVYVYDSDGMLLNVNIYKDGVYCCEGQL